MVVLPSWGEPVPLMRKIGWSGPTERALVEAGFPAEVGTCRRLGDIFLSWGWGSFSARPACLPRPVPKHPDTELVALSAGCTAHLLCSLHARKEARLPFPFQRDLKIHRHRRLPGWS